MICVSEVKATARREQQQLSEMQQLEQRVELASQEVKLKLLKQKLQHLERQALDDVVSSVTLAKLQHFLKSSCIIRIVRKL